VRSGGGGSDHHHSDSYNANYRLVVVQGPSIPDDRLEGARSARQVQATFDDVAEDAVSLTNVWVQTQGDGLVRADQIVGIEAHQTPALAGKPARWLFDVVLTSSIGSGTREGWGVTVLHRTLIQTGEDPGDAPAETAGRRDQRSRRRTSAARARTPAS
jgi:hypothetical protein